MLSHFARIPPRSRLNSSPAALLGTASAAPRPGLEFPERRKVQRAGASARRATLRSTWKSAWGESAERQCKFPAIAKAARARPRSSCKAITARGPHPRGPYTGLRTLRGAAHAHGRDFGAPRVMQPAREESESRRGGGGRASLHTGAYGRAADDRYFTETAERRLRVARAHEPVRGCTGRSPEFGCASGSEGLV